jgi:hypothetical protein
MRTVRLTVGFGGILDRREDKDMKIKVEVDLYSNGGCSTVEVVLTDDDLRTLAENKAMDEYACDSCKAEEIELMAVWSR